MTKLDASKIYLFFYFVLQSTFKPLPMKQGHSKLQGEANTMVQYSEYLNTGTIQILDLVKFSCRMVTMIEYWAKCSGSLAMT